MSVIVSELVRFIEYLLLFSYFSHFSNNLAARTKTKKAHLGKFVVGNTKNLDHRLHVDQLNPVIIKRSCHVVV